MESAREVRRTGHHRIVDKRKTPSPRWLAKGTVFEGYVRGLFPEEVFSVLHDTSQDSRPHDAMHSILNPDFRLRHEPSRHSFWVECKFRSSARYGVVSWSAGASQYERYLEFQKRVRPEKVYIVIGLVGSPSKPKFMYCIPLDEIQEPDIYIDEMVKFKRHSTAIFNYRQGRLW